MEFNLSAILLITLLLILTALSASIWAIRDLITLGSELAITNKNLSTIIPVTISYQAIDVLSTFNQYSIVWSSRDFTSSNIELEPALYSLTLKITFDRTPSNIILFTSEDSIDIANGSSVVSLSLIKDISETSILSLHYNNAQVIFDKTYLKITSLIKY